jgi:hypothetical protein
MAGFCALNFGADEYSVWGLIVLSYDGLLWTLCLMSTQFGAYETQFWQAFMHSVWGLMSTQIWRIFMYSVKAGFYALCLIVFKHAIWQSFMHSVLAGLNASTFCELLGKTVRRCDLLFNFCHFCFLLNQAFYKKRLVVQNKLNLLLKIILYNTWTFQLFAIYITN